jgi:hypothetical protein
VNRRILFKPTQHQVKLLKEQIINGRSVRKYNGKKIALTHISDWANNTYLQIVNPSSTFKELSEAFIPMIIEATDIVADSRKFRIDMTKTVQQTFDT